MSYFIKVSCLGEGDSSHSEEITIVKANQNKDLVVEDLKTILSSINATLSSFKEKDELYEFNYVLKIVYNHEMVMQVIEGEYALFQEVVKHEELFDETISYINTAAKGRYNNRIWEDCETPLGNGAMISLVETDKKYIQSYINFLRTCDLDHEVCQWGDIDTIVKKYGFNEETVKLGIARLMSCAGQHGDEQFEIFLEEGLADYISENKSTFMTLFVEETTYSLYHNNYYYNYLEAPKTEFVEDVLESITIVTDILEDEDIEFYKQELTRLWLKHRAN